VWQKAEAWRLTVFPLAVPPAMPMRNGAARVVLVVALGLLHASRAASSWSILPLGEQLSGLPSGGLEDEFLSKLKPFSLRGSSPAIEEIVAAAEASFSLLCKPEADVWARPCSPFPSLADPLESSLSSFCSS
jgi:hypothetical protein